MSVAATKTDPSSLARQFHALSDPTRLAIMASLRSGECCVCDLQTSLAAAQSRLSFHLRVLKDAGLIIDRKDGRWSYYQLVSGAVESLCEGLLSLGNRRAPVTRELPQISVFRGTADADASGCCG
jgi:ArsR family transcriptional regulator